MTQATQIYYLPARKIPLSYLDTIIDKKVNGAALTCLEKIVDWFLTTFSCFNRGYNERYQEKLTNRITDNILYSDVNDIEKIEVGSLCGESMPCFHSEVTVFLKDGRHATSGMNGVEIWRIVSQLALAGINPSNPPNWDAIAVIDHFRVYQR